MPKNHDEQYDPFEEAGPADDLVEQDAPQTAAGGKSGKKRRAQREKRFYAGLLGVLFVTLLGTIGYRLIAARLAAPPRPNDGPPVAKAALKPDSSLVQPTAPPVPPPATFKMPEKAQPAPPPLPALSAPAAAAPPAPLSPAPPSGFALAKPALESPPALPGPPPADSIPSLLSAPDGPPHHQRPPSHLTSDGPRSAAMPPRDEPPALAAGADARFTRETTPSPTHWRNGQSDARFNESPPSLRTAANDGRGAAEFPPRRPPPDAGLRTDGTYKIQPNDNYWVISERLYGAGAYFKALAELNRQTMPEIDRLQVGATIVAPPVEELQKKYADLCPKPERRPSAAARMTSVGLRGNAPGRRVYIVEPGDNLFEIARRELGRADRWAEIYDLNRDRLGDDTNYVAPGMRLTMPDREPRGPTGRVAERSDDRQRR